MKKWLALVLACVMSLSLIACGGGKTEEKPAEEKPAQTETTPTETPAEKVVFKLASNAPVVDGSLEHEAAKLFIAKVDELSGGTMECEYYPAGQLGSSTDITEGASMGTIEMTASLSWDLYANMEPSAGIMNMPFLFNDYDHMKAAFENGNEVTTKIIQNMIDNIDVRTVGYSYRPFRCIIISENTGITNIESPYDMAGLNFRTPEAKTNMLMVEAWGATPVTITLNELYTALTTGTADAAEMDMIGFYDRAFQDIISCAVETNHMVVSNLLVCNNTWYEGLSAEHQAVIDEASQAYTDYTWEHFMDYSDEAWEAFEAAGCHCIYADEVDSEAYRESTKDIYKEFVEMGWFEEEDYWTLRNLEY